MSENEKGEEKQVTVVRNATDLQRLKLEKLMKNPEKLAFIPDRPKDKRFSDPAEFVRNVMGSSAGAGSGEFHVYRHIRRREYARQDFLQNCKEKDTLDIEYHIKLEENKRAVEDKAAKKRAKRQRQREKQKAKKQKLKDMKKKGITVAEENSSSSESSSEEEEEEEMEAEENKGKEMEAEENKGKEMEAEENKGKEMEAEENKGKEMEAEENKGKEMEAEENKGKEKIAEENKGKEKIAEETKGKETREETKGKDGPKRIRRESDERDEDRTLGLDIKEKGETDQSEKSK